MTASLREETQDAFRTLYRALSRAGREALEFRFRVAREVLHEAEQDWCTRRLGLGPGWFAIGQSCIREVMTRINVLEAGYDAMRTPLTKFPEEALK